MHGLNMSLIGIHVLRVCQRMYVQQRISHLRKVFVDGRLFLCTVHKEAPGDSAVAIGGMTATNGTAGGEASGYNVLYICFQPIYKS